MEKMARGRKICKKCLTLFEIKGYKYCPYCGVVLIEK